MAMLKNIVHEHFVREYVRNGGNGAAAYRYVSAMFNRKTMRNPESAAICAIVIRKRPEVQRREMELRELMVKKSDITIEKVLSDYQLALDMAKTQAKPNEIVSAATAQAKLVGLLRDRVETGNVGDFDGMENVSEILEKLAEEEGPEAALLASKMLGLEADKTADKDNGDSDLMDQPSPSDSVN